MNRETEAQELWEENLRVKEGVLGKNDIQLVPHLNNAATSYAHSGLFDKCEPLFRRSLKLTTVHFGPRAPQVSIPLEMLATALHHLGRGFEGEPLAREAVAIRESHFGENHPTTGKTPSFHSCSFAFFSQRLKIRYRETLVASLKQTDPSQ